MPKSPLTVTEAETLAVMLNSASEHMARVRVPGRDYGYAWPGTTGIEAATEMIAAFYDIAPFGVYV